MILSRRSGAATGSLHPHLQPVSLYITYARPQDAAACLAGVDDTTTSDGNRLRAVWATTKYCSAWLRGLKCPNDNCQQAHELGEEVDSASAREEMSSM